MDYKRGQVGDYGNVRPEAYARAVDYGGLSNGFGDYNDLYDQVVDFLRQVGDYISDVLEYAMSRFAGVYDSLDDLEGLVLMGSHGSRMGKRSKARTEKGWYSRAGNGGKGHRTKVRKPKKKGKGKNKG
ncbi:hypothetical protein GF386_02515 [Candidatus Pacearchaeota archaeon]|nr:hypothetical protein [Candidatus Pacearchaeota archaeon]MBD3283017.1 hypothetical protein [Candidatus Pacearchaeota archaeon]